MVILEDCLNLEVTSDRANLVLTKRPLYLVVSINSVVGHCRSRPLLMRLIWNHLSRLVDLLFKGLITQGSLLVG